MQKKWSVIYYPFKELRCPSTSKNFLTDLILSMCAAYNAYSTTDFCFIYQYICKVPVFLLLCKIVNTFQVGPKSQTKVLQEFQQHLFAIMLLLRYFPPS